MCIRDRDKTPELLEKYAEIVPMLEEMNELRKILVAKRKKRGSVNFDLPESKIILDEQGKPIDIKPYDRNIATNQMCIRDSATPVTLEGVELVQSIRMEAGCLRFSVVRDGILNFVEGDKVQFYVDGLLRFAGWVMTKERTSAQIIAVTAYDMLFYLAKNKDTYVYWDKTATEVAKMIAAGAGLPVGLSLIHI